MVEERAPASVSKPPETPAAQAGLGLVDVRRVWPDILDRVKQARRFTWILLSQNAQVIGLEGNVLTLGFKTAGARESFTASGSDEILRQAAVAAIGADWRVEAIVDPSADPGAGTAPVITRPATAEPTRAETAPAAQPDAPAQQSSPPARATIEAARSNITQTRTGEQPVQRDDRDDDVDRDDPPLDDAGVDSAELLRRELGATVIDEIPHD